MLFRRFWYYAAQKIRPFFDVDMNGKKISGLPTTSYPTENSQAATKKYVDEQTPGGGDMLKSTYDPNLDGIVDNSEKLEGSSKAQVRDHTPKAHTLDSHALPGASVNLNSKKIISLADPTTDQDGATKKYVDDNAGGVDDHAELTNVLPNQHHTKFTITEHDSTTRHPVSVIKTSTGSASGSLGNGATLNINMNRKSFFPSVSTEHSIKMTARDGYGSDPNDYKSRFGLYNDVGAESDYWIKWDYLSSSGPPQIWVIVDVQGHILHCWEAADASDPDNPDVSPIEVEEEDGSKVTAIKVVIPNNYKTIKKAAKQVREALSQYLIDQYSIDLKTKKLKKK